MKTNKLLLLMIVDCWSWGCWMTALWDDSLRIRLYVLRKGFSLPSYSEDGIETHPNTSWWFQSI